MPSLTATLFQSAMHVLLAGKRPTDETQLAAIRRTKGGGPSAKLRKRCDVDVHDIGGFPVVTMAPKDGRRVRGHVFYLPGGGYVNPPSFLHWRFIARLVKTHDVACSVPHYPLAPEHDCEAGIAFSSEAYRRLAAAHGADRIIVMGDSAGGGLALATLQRTMIKPAGLMLNAPWLDAGVSDPSQPAIEAEDFLLNRVVLRGWGQWWAGARTLQDPMVSPLFGDLSILPPTLLLCGSADILVADARRLAKAAGGTVRYVEEPGMMHVYPLIPFFPEARRAWAEIAAFVDRTLPRS